MTTQPHPSTGEVPATTGAHGLPAANQPSNHLCPCLIAAQFLKVAGAVALLVMLIGGVVEFTLRRAGVKPRVLDAAGLTPVIPDGWTGYRLRPEVVGPVEWVQTNDLGMHAPRSFPLARPSGVLRVAVLGSSVVYGLGQYFNQTIPYSIERGLAESGYRAEVLNFGTHSFNIVNISAMMQAYIHQFDPNWWWWSWTSRSAIRGGPW